MAVYMLAVPFAVMTFSPRLGPWMQRVGLEIIPEDPTPAREVAHALATNPRAVENGDWF